MLGSHKEYVLEKGYTCILCRGIASFIENLLSHMEDGKDFSDLAPLDDTELRRVGFFSPSHKIIWSFSVISAMLLAGHWKGRGGERLSNPKDRENAALNFSRGRFEKYLYKGDLKTALEQEREKIKEDPLQSQVSTVIEIFEI